MVGDRIAGRFRIEAEVHPRVWRAFDDWLGVTVALKFGGYEDLKREAGITRQLSHRNIVRMHDLHDPGKPFLSMEWLDGPTLEAAWPTLCAPDKVLLADQLRSALVFAKVHDVTHGDVHARNVILSHGRPVLIDWAGAGGHDAVGLVKMLDDLSSVAAAGDGRTPGRVA